MTSQPSEFDVHDEVDADPRRIDEGVGQFMLNEAYWNPWQTREDIERQIRGAWRLVGAYVAGTNEMVLCPGHPGRGE